MTAFKDLSGEALLEAARASLRGPVLVGGRDVEDIPLDQRPVFSDVRNMERLRDSLEGMVVFTDVGALFWCGTHWKADANAVEAQGRRLSQIVYSEAGDLVRVRKQATSAVERAALDARIKALTDAAAKAESRRVIDNALALLKRELRQEVDKLNSDPLLFNVTNGTIDLRDGTLRPHDPNDWITQYAPVKFDRDAQCPRFLQFLQEVFQEDVDLIAYMRRSIGYCLTGLTTEHVLSVWLGTGANGKSTLLRVVQELMGDYGSPLDVAVLEQTYGRDASRDAVRFMGKRLVVASESGERSVLREGFIKMATGGDRLSARKLYCEATSFNPTHKLALVTNHRPKVEGTDPAIWRRIALVPFDVAFSPENADRELVSKLLGELPGILNWAIAGCLEWQRIGGLCAPQRVARATRDYRLNEDTVARFLAADVLAPCAGAVTQWRDVGEAYQTWCAANAAEPVGNRKLNLRLRELIGAQAFGVGTGGRAVLRGHAIRSEAS